MSTYKFARGAVIPIEAQFWTNASPRVGKTGLTPTLSIMRLSDDKFLKSDATWVTPESTLYTLAPVDATHRPGLYLKSWTPPDQNDRYRVLIDAGTSTSISDRYIVAEIEVLVADELMSVTVSPTVGVSYVDEVVADTFNVQRGTDGANVIWLILDQDGVAIDHTSNVVTLDVCKPSAPQTVLRTVTETETDYGQLVVASNQITLVRKAALVPDTEVLKYFLWRTTAGGLRSLSATGTINVKDGPVDE
jgi:hypothetical protein